MLKNTVTLASQISRDHRIDLLRGIALISMMLNHLPGKYSQCIRDLFGFSSFAEVFVLLSGVVAGYVYCHALVQKGEAELNSKIRNRARNIYLYHISIFLILFLISLFFTSVKPFWYKAMIPVYDHRLSSFIAGLFLLYAPFGANLLPMYVIFVLIVPFFLRAIHAGHIRTAFFITLALWLLAQFHIFYRMQIWVNQYIPMHWAIFDPMAWWLIFASGIYLGFRKLGGLQVPPALLRRCAVLAMPFLIFLFGWRHHWIELPQQGWMFRHVTGLQNLGLLRLFNFMLWGIVMLDVGRFFALHKWMIFRPFAFLGRHSLQVYCYHVQMLFMLYLTIDFWNSPQNGLQGVAIATLLLSLWLPAGLHAWYRNLKTRIPSHVPSH